VAGATKLDVYNLALSYLDLSARVQSVTEQSAQAGYCRAMYDRARMLVLEQCYWSFSTIATALPLLLDQQTITIASDIVYPGWRYVYSRPVTCLKAQAVTTQYGLRAYPTLGYYWGRAGSSVQWGRFRPPWIETLDQVNEPAGNAIDILTDQDNAWLVYTVDNQNVSIWPEVMIDCVAWQLAVLIAGPASANQDAKQMAIKMAGLSLSRALAQNLNEQQEDPYPESPSIQARL